MGKRIVFTGGGTGGHVFPGLAVAEMLQLDGTYELMWMGSCRGIEYEIVRRWNIPFCSIPAGKLRRYFSLQNVLDVFRVAAGFIASLFRFVLHRPALVFSKGGYVTVPPVYAARMLGIPVITHDSDVDPGLATRLNAKVATAICVPYEQSVQYFPSRLRSRIIVTGNPVRAEISVGDPQRFYERSSLRRDLPLVFVQGGSQGAEELNRLLLPILPDLLPICVVVHQTGAAGRAASQQFLADNPQLKNCYYCADFFTDEYADILQAATLSVSRAGAGSLWELAASNTPGIILPLVVGSRGDQVRNAEVFAAMGMITVLNSEERNSRMLRQKIIGLLNNSDRLHSMRASAGAFQGGARHLADVCRGLL